MTLWAYIWIQHDDAWSRIIKALLVIQHYTAKSCMRTVYTRSEGGQSKFHSKVSHVSGFSATDRNWLQEPSRGEESVRNGDCNPWINGAKWKSIVPPPELILFSPPRSTLMYNVCSITRWLYYSMTTSSLKDDVSRLNPTNSKGIKW